MNKHAYLIIAHNNFYVLEKMLRLIDDKRNDIYIHIDKKVKNFDFIKYKNVCKDSVVRYTKKRYSCKWGDSSLVRAEMQLFSEAFDMGYEYYHLLSGADLPIKSQDYIHNFCSKNRYEFIELAPGEHSRYKFRLSRYHLDQTIPIFQKISPYFDMLQDKLKINRIKKNIRIYKGSQWASLSHQCVALLIQNKKKILKMTRFSLCADEVYKQTIILNSRLADDVNPYKDIRLIDWERHEGESPHTFTFDDYGMIVGSSCLFARKFIKDRDKKIIDRVYNFVKESESDLRNIE